MKNIGKLMDMLGYGALQATLAVEAAAAAGANAAAEQASKATKKLLKNADHLLK